MDRKSGVISPRELLGFGLLLILLLAGLLCSWYMPRQHGQIAAALEDSAWMALSGQWENARKTAASAKENWEQQWKLWAAFGDHTPMEEIDALFAELTIYAAAEEQTDFAHTCGALSRRVEAMGKAHQFSWWNVL